MWRWKNEAGLAARFVDKGLLLQAERQVENSRIGLRISWMYQYGSFYSMEQFSDLPGRATLPACVGNVTCAGR